MVLYVIEYTGRQGAIVPKTHLGVAQLVARYLGVVEAASSSLVTQTKKTSSLGYSFFFILQGFSALFGCGFFFFRCH